MLWRTGCWGCFSPRCQFHLQLNAAQHAPRQSVKPELAADLRMIFNAPSPSRGRRLSGRGGPEV